jgi:hypothetical protein
MIARANPLTLRCVDCGARYVAVGSVWLSKGESEPTWASYRVEDLHGCWTNSWENPVFQRSPGYFLSVNCVSMPAFSSSLPCYNGPGLVPTECNDDDDVKPFPRQLTEKWRLTVSLVACNVCSKLILRKTLLFFYCSAVMNFWPFGVGRSINTSWVGSLFNWSASLQLGGLLCSKLPYCVLAVAVEVVFSWTISFCDHAEGGELNTFGILVLCPCFATGLRGKRTNGFMGFSHICGGFFGGLIFQAAMWDLSCRMIVFSCFRISCNFLFGLVCLPSILAGCVGKFLKHVRVYTLAIVPLLFTYMCKLVQHSVQLLPGKFTMPSDMVLNFVMFNNFMEQCNLWCYGPKQLHRILFDVNTLLCICCDEY